MARRNASDSRTNVPARPAGATAGDGGSPPKLRGWDSNPQGAFGPQFWQAFSDCAVRFYDTLSLPHPSEKARFTLSSRSYATPRGTLMRCQGTAFIVTRGPAFAARGPDQLLIVLQAEGSVDCDYGGRHWRREPGDVAIVDYARPFRNAATDYVSLMLVLTRGSVPAALLGVGPHGLIFPCASGSARLIGRAMQELYAQADDLTVSEAEAAIEGIVALTTACARARLAGDEADHVELRRRAVLDYIDAHLGDLRLKPDKVANAANVSRATLYRLLAGEGGIRAVLLKRRLDQALTALARRRQKRALAEGNRQVLRL